MTTTIGDGEIALNKLAWDMTGRKCSVGASNGAIHIYDIGDMAVPHPDDHATFQKVVSELEKRPIVGAASMNEMSVGH